MFRNKKLSMNTKDTKYGIWKSKKGQGWVHMWCSVRVRVRVEEGLGLGIE